MYDLRMNYDNLNKLDNPTVYAILCKLFPAHKLFDISLGWRTNRNFILKSRGAHGDVIVGWR